MAIKRYVADADNTVVNTYKPDLETRGTGSNTGRSDIVEAYSIYGRQQASSSTYQGSQELSRILMSFPVTSISKDRTNSVIPASGSVSFYLKLFNAEHTRTVPRDITLMVYPISQSWQEGEGLDLINYEDLTRGRPGSNWMSASNTSAWDGTSGGTYITASNQWNPNVSHSVSSLGSPPFYSQSFATGLEDLEINITPLVELWVSGAMNNYGVGIQLTSSQEAYYDTSDAAIAASGSIQFNSAIAADYDGETFTVESTDGTEVVYTLDDDASSNTYGASTTNIGIQGMAEDASKAAELVTAAGNNSSNAHYGKITFVEGASATVALTQDTRGNAGNNSISTSDSTDITVLGFGGGTNAGPILPITGGAMQSYYTKRFFARGTQYFFKRPIIEARWDSAKRDDRGNFYYSSSLAPAEDNLNTIYLYNYVRGRLRNIPAIGSTGSIMVSLYSGSSDDSAPSGSKLILYNTTTPVTGGWKSTGIYTASIAVTAAATRVQTLYDVWWSGSGAGESLESGVTEFVTGAIKPDLDVGFKDIRDPVYYLNITNLKNKYTTQETARLNLFVRSKFWNPTIHTKANATVDNTAIISASYRVFRVLDGLEAVQYDTGSTFGTGLSYDVSGNYFDFDMGLLKGGYAYGFKFAFYDPELSSWIEQNKVFKFRVEEYEY